MKDFGLSRQQNETVVVELGRSLHTLMIDIEIFWLLLPIKIIKLLKNENNPIVQTYADVKIT